MRIEKLKWNQQVSSAGTGWLLDPDDDLTDEGAVAWFVAAGTERSHPTKGTADLLAADEVWAAVPGEWWVLCARAEPDGGPVTEWVLHAAAPFTEPVGDLLRWVDLDLDFEVHGTEVNLEDERQFHEHARSMHYPDEVVRGAWSGISGLAPRYTTGEWPFDGWADRCLARARKLYCV